MQWLADAILASASPDSLEGSLAMAFKAGDQYAGPALADWVEETQVTHTPFKLGEKVFIFSVTLYYVGRVSEIGLGWIRLTDCSWIHWTGRLGSLFATCDLRRAHGGRKPRTEYIGTYTFFLQSGVGYREWNGDLPTESLQ